MGTPAPIQAANLGMADSLILMVLALVVFGPRRLPQIGRQIGKLMYEFRKASNDFKFQMEEELRSAEEADRRKREEAERQRTLALNPPAQTTAAENTSPQAPSTDSEQSQAASSLPPESTHGDFGAQEAPAEENQPRIQPPSTGETVATSRPGSVAVPKSEAQSEPAAPASTTIDTTLKESEAATEESRAVTEQAAHNG
jgi:sec-independent protein translocase protein TatB